MYWDLLYLDCSDSTTFRVDSPKFRSNILPPSSRSRFLRSTRNYNPEAPCPTRFICNENLHLKAVTLCCLSSPTETLITRPDTQNFQLLACGPLLQIFTAFNGRGNSYWLVWHTCSTSCGVWQHCWPCDKGINRHFTSNLGDKVTRLKWGLVASHPLVLGPVHRTFVHAQYSGLRRDECCLLRLEDGRSIFLHITGKLIPDYTKSQSSEPRIRSCVQFTNYMTLQWLNPYSCTFRQQRSPSGHGVACVLEMPLCAQVLSAGQCRYWTCPGNFEQWCNTACWYFNRKYPYLLQANKRSHYWLSQFSQFSPIFLCSPLC